MTQLPRLPDELPIYLKILFHYAQNHEISRSGDAFAYRNPHAWPVTLLYRTKLLARDPLVVLHRCVPSLDRLDNAEVQIGRVLESTGVSEWLPMNGSLCACWVMRS